VRSSNGQDRRPLAVVVTTDGRRVYVPVEDDSLEVSLLSLIRSLVAGLESLLGLLITGSRREDRGTRRDGR
jgi:DNA-binding beta-propeller fold protein YncE